MHSENGRLDRRRAVRSDLVTTHRRGKYRVGSKVPRLWCTSTQLPAGTVVPMDEQTVRMANALLLPGFGGTVVPPWLRSALGEGLAGVVYFSHNVTDPRQVAALSAQLHAAGNGVLIAVDEEGGTVTRLHTRDGSPYPSPAAVGEADDVELTAAHAGAIGAELRRAGIDINLAPVVDVNTNPANPVIGVRSFGADPERVARHGAAFVAGLQRAGVAASAKHFPGHGDTNVDSHIGLPRIDASAATVRNRELVPFVAAIRAGTRAILTAHVIVSELDDRPATLSPVVLRLLRDELHFDGVVITDALDMQAISRTIGIGEGAVQAVLAGADLLCLGNPMNAGEGGDLEQYLPARDALAAAIETGRIGLGRRAQAARRRAELISWLAQARAVEQAGPSEVALDIARRAVRSSPGTAGSVRTPAHVVDLRVRGNIAAGRQSPVLADALVLAIPGTTVQLFTGSVLLPPISPGIPSGAGRIALVGSSVATQVDRVDASLSSAQGRPLVVLTGAADPDSAEGHALRRLRTARPDLVVVFTGWPPALGEPVTDLGERFVLTYGDSRPTARAVAELLTGS